MTILEPVRHAVEVAAEPPAAFDAFVDRIGEWWPIEHTIGVAEKATARMERGEGGRVLEVGVDGSECRWGTVLVWEPPERLVVAWQITPRWTPEPELARSSEYEVRFVRLAPGRTRVEVEHRHLERHGEGGHGMRAAVDSPDGWPGVLASYAVIVAG